MVLEKLVLFVEGESGYQRAFVALFNPNQIVYHKSANWEPVPTAQKDAPKSQFTFGNPATLSLQLLLDTYEKKISVRVLTGMIEEFVTIRKELHRPPICRLIWGAFGGFEGNFFQGILEQVNLTYTLFLPDGTPVRATADCTFREFRSPNEDPRLQSSDVAKTRTVRLGDTLASLAAEEYRDPRMWRPIAKENGIDDPLSITPGQVLAIPALVPGSGKRRG